MPAVTTEAPAPEPSVDPRSPEALAAQLVFTSPPQDDPAVQDGIDGYAEFLRQYIIAEGLGDRDYPPFLALIINPQDPTFVTSVVSGIKRQQALDVYILGAFTDRVNIVRTWRARYSGLTSPSAVPVIMTRDILSAG